MSPIREGNAITWVQGGFWLSPSFLGISLSPKFLIIFLLAILDLGTVSVCYRHPRSLQWQKNTTIFGSHVSLVGISEDTSRGGKTWVLTGALFPAHRFSARNFETLVRHDSLPALTVMPIWNRELSLLTIRKPDGSKLDSRMNPAMRWLTGSHMHFCGGRSQEPHSGKSLPR